MTRLGIGVLLVAAAIVLTAPATAAASCVPFTVKQQKRRADVIFVGTALEGPTETGVQRFGIERYEKGSGPDVVPVQTGVIVHPDGSGSLTSVSVEARGGERWRIYGMKRSGGVVETNECDGSTKLAAVAAPRSADPRPAANREGAWMLLVGMGLAGSVLIAFLLRRRYRRLKIAPVD
jgi:hypothetical protein